MTGPSDAATFKARQQRDWDAVASGWAKWRETLESGTGVVTERMLEMARVRPGLRILDIACGTGEPALTAAVRTGPRGEVVAVDQAPAMLALAERRAKALGIDNVRFVVSDGESMDEVEAGFDAILCRWGLMFFPDLQRGLRRIHSLLRADHPFVAAVWSRPERVPSINLAIGVVSELLEVPPAQPGAPGPFRLADSEALRRSFIEAGFRNVYAEYMPVAFEAPSAQAYMELTRDLSAPIVALVEGQSEERREQIWEAVRAAAERFTLPDGRVRMWNETICITGVR